MSEPEENVVPLKVKKPSFQERFKVKKPPNIAGVETLLQALPVLKIHEANDFVRVHPNEDEFWSDRLYFVNVPILGTKREQLHIICEELAAKYISSKRLTMCRLALATKPHNVFFLCKVPTENVDNAWNMTALSAIEKAKHAWVDVSSRRPENVDGYKVDYARDKDAFPDPQWGTRNLDEILEVTFRGCSIDTEDHAGLLRIIGGRQDLK
jgi:hypothetical protein